MADEQALGPLSLDTLKMIANGLEIPNKAGIASMVDEFDDDAHLPIEPRILAHELIVRRGVPNLESV